MGTAALPKDSSLLPQQPGGNGMGFMLALLAHVALIVALAFGVNWRASEPEGVQAELWAAVPQTAAPAPQEPPAPVVKETPKPAPSPPPPQAKDTQRDAQIAIEQRREKERQLKQQREAEQKEKEKRAQREKEQREKEQQRAKQEELKQQQQKQKEEAARIEALRQQNLKRILGQAGATSPDATGNAARTAGPSATYAGRVIARIKPNIVLVDEVPGNPEADVEVRISPDGTIISRTIVKSSGVKEWDEAVLRAIDRTQVLPRDVDGRVPPSMTITFRPKN